MRAKKKLKHGEAFIDKHFVLKLLLEVYAFERIKSEKIFDSTFHLKMKKSFITYHDYQGFMRQNFPSLSSTDIALLYR